MAGYSHTIDPELVPWLDEVAAVFEDARRVRQSIGTPMIANSSPAGKELQYWQSQGHNDEAFLRVHRLFQMWTVVSADLLVGIGALCRAHEVVFSPLSLARSSFEYCNRVVWLLDPDIEPNQRVARALLDELFSADETCRAVSHLTHKGSPEHQAVRQGLKDVRAEILDLFPEAIVDGSPRQFSVGKESFPMPTDAAEHFGQRWTDARQWEGTYDGLSLYTHPGVGALEFFEPIGESFRVTSDKETLDKVFRAVLVGYYQALRHVVTYTKWSLTEFQKWEERLGQAFQGIFVTTES